MREQLIQYIDLLFAGAADCEEIKEEILQNTLDRYDDLVAQGKVPEAAYRLAIAGIGDINELLGTQPSDLPTDLPTSSAAGITPKSLQPDTEKKKVMRALSAGLYILSIAPLYIFNGNSVGICGFLLLVASATVLWMLGYEKKEPAPTAGTVCGQKRLPLWAIILILFATGVFLSITLGLHQTSNYHTAAATEAVEIPLVDSADSAVANATATAHVNVRCSPSPEASIVGMVSPGEYLTVSLSETVSGKDWSYITSPVAGWVASEYIQMELIEDYGYSVPQQTGTQAKVINSTEVYTAPTPEASAACALNLGETVTVTRQETVNNTPWCYVTEPASGWVQTVYLEFTDTPEVTVESAVEETMVSSQTWGHGCHASDVKSLDIYWPYGSLLILTKDTDRISVEESYNGTDSDMRIQHIGDEMEIRFCEGEPEQWENVNKELRITVPADWICGSLEITGDLADVEICDLTITELDYEGKSGYLEVSNCIIEEADLETTSGSISFVGNATLLNIEGDTAAILAKLYNIPSRIEVNSLVGDVTLMLPETTGFTLQTIHEFETDFDVTEENDRYIAGNGSARIKLNSPSGLSAILKNK